MEDILNQIIDIFNTPLMVVGGTSLTLGYLVFMVVKFLVPKDKIIEGQDKVISTLKIQNDLLKEQVELNEQRIATLEEKLNVVINNSSNKKVKGAKNLVAEAKKIYDKVDIPESKKRKRIKVKKVVEVNE